MEAYLQPLVSCHIYTAIIRLKNYNSIRDIEHSPNYTAFSLPRTHRVK